MRSSQEGLKYGCGMILIMVFATLSIAKGDITAADRAAHPGMKAWEINYEKPAEIKDVWLALDYKFWDVKVDGDVPSSRKLLAISYKTAPAHLTIKIFIGAKQSVVCVMEGVNVVGSGCLIDSSYALAAKPKTNYDGFYILAQKPNDVKKPATMGDVQEASSWVQLSIGSPP